MFIIVGILVAIVMDYLSIMYKFTVKYKSLIVYKDKQIT